MKYKLLTDINVEGLETQVNELLEEGWKLHCNTFVVEGVLTIYHQAMIKEEKEDNETMLTED